jgi:hypothetical protein
LQREPLDQIDLKDGVDATLTGGGGSFWKLPDRGYCQGPGDTMVGPASPTWQPLGGPPWRGVF